MKKQVPSLSQAVSAVFAQIPQTAPIAVAVSGGADSLALAIALAQETTQNHPLTAITVDHGIRPESAQEAQFVHHILQKHQINHIILTNKDVPPQSHIEEWARQIRYNLLCDYCNQNNIPYLFLAHHAIDQAETFFIRLAHASGLEGLCAMRPFSKRGNITLVRPLLNIPKAELVSFLTQKNISWIEDPMNQEVHYERVKWRHFLPQLTQTGLHIHTLTTSVNRLTRANQALEIWTDTAFKSIAFQADEGYIHLKRNAFSELPDEIKIRLLIKALNTINPQAQPVSLSSVENILLLKERHYTLAGCLIVVHKKGLFITKEPCVTAKETIIKAHTPTQWDRFLIQAPYTLKVKAQAPKTHLKNIPFSIQKSFPCFQIQEKELENFIDIDYKEWQKYHIDIHVLKDEK